MRPLSDKRNNATTDSMQLPNRLFFEQIEALLVAGEEVQIRMRGHSMRPLLRDGRDVVLLTPIARYTRTGRAGCGASEDAPAARLRSGSTSRGSNTSGGANMSGGANISGGGNDSHDKSDNAGNLRGDTGTGHEDNLGGSSDTDNAGTSGKNSNRCGNGRDRNDKESIACGHYISDHTGAPGNDNDRNGNDGTLPGGSDSDNAGTSGKNSNRCGNGRDRCIGKHSPTEAFDPACSNGRDNDPNGNDRNDGTLPGSNHINRADNPDSGSAASVRTGTEALEPGDVVLFRYGGQHILHRIVRIDAEPRNDADPSGHTPPAGGGFAHRRRRPECRRQENMSAAAFAKADSPASELRRFTLAGDGNFGTTEHCAACDILAVLRGVIRPGGRFVSCRSSRWLLASRCWLAFPSGMRHLLLRATRAILNS